MTPRARGRGRRGWDCAVVCALAACHHAAPPARPQGDRSAAVVAASERSDDGAGTTRTRALADAAAVELARALEGVEATCRTRWSTWEEVCAGREAWREIAMAYQAHYGIAVDPRQNDGRVDALPRLGGVDLDIDEVTRRITWHCTERCETARRLAVGEAVTEAVSACAEGAKSACAELARHENGAAHVKTCERRCDDQKSSAKQEREHEARRPRTKTQAIACLKTCMRDCTGGRIVVDASGHYAKPPDDWCATCDFSCASECKTWELGVGR